MTCAGSPLLIDRLTAEGKINPRASSGAADEGTAAHQVRADCLEIGLDAYDFIGTSLKINGVDYPCDDTMADHLQVGIDWIREQSGQVIVERRVDLSHWMPGQFGTLDTAIINRPARKATTNDLKYGAGVPVSPENNKQLMIYSLGVVDNFDLWDVIDTFDIIIDQPRAGGLKFWSVSMADLLVFGEEVREAAKRTEDPDAPLVASEDGCKWCPVKDTDSGCPAYNRWQLDNLGSAFDDLPDLDAEPVFPHPDAITPERRYYIVKHAHLATRWLADLHERSIDAARLGRPDPGSKLVAGQRGNRYFTDKAAAEAILVPALGDEAFSKSLIGIPDAEKQLAPTKRKPGDPDAWAKLSALIDQKEGKPILVPADDPRPPLASLKDEFDDL